MSVLMNSKISKKSIIHEYDGWCDDPSEPKYNKYVDLRQYNLSKSYEKLYLSNDLYDIVLVVGYNDNPIVSGKGSAIFTHVSS